MNNSVRPRYRPEDRVRGNGLELPDATLVNFWQWAFVDLCDDDVKGIFAEWLVMKLLGERAARRVSWANSDLITEDGVRIEVKSTAFWQSWKLLDEFGRPTRTLRHEPADTSRIRFGGLKARDATGQTRHDPRLKSHIYVFAFQHETDPNVWNALDLEQWEFYIFSAEGLSSFCGGSVTLAQLRARQTAMSAAQFAHAAKVAVHLAAREREEPTRESKPVSTE